MIIYIVVNKEIELSIWKGVLEYENIIYKNFILFVSIHLKYNAFEIVFAILFLKGGSKGTTRKEKEGFQSFGWIWRKNEWGL